MTLKRRWNALRNAFVGLGVPAALKYVWCHALGRGDRTEYSLHPRGIAHPVVIRRSASDVYAFKQIFAEREYACLEGLRDVRLVIDCGANVGYSSAYFLSTFPKCEVIAVEPDPGNFAALERNLEAYGKRAKCIRAGIWSQTAPLAISQGAYKDGREWSRQVRMCEPGETAEFLGVDVGSLLAESGYQRISVLKMDVEGAEAVVFAENYQSWLSRVDAIAVELHDDSSFGNASDVFFAAIEGQGFDVSTSGELTICRRR